MLRRLLLRVTRAGADCLLRKSLGVVLGMTDEPRGRPRRLIGLWSVDAVARLGSGANELLLTMTTSTVLVVGEVGPTGIFSVLTGTLKYC